MTQATHMKIGELSRQTETSVETIRFYEREGLLPQPARTSSNYRTYAQPHVERLQFIRHWSMVPMDARSSVSYP